MIGTVLCHCEMKLRRNLKEIFSFANRTNIKGISKRHSDVWFSLIYVIYEADLKALQITTHSKLRLSAKIFRTSNTRPV